MVPPQHVCWFLSPILVRWIDHTPYRIHLVLLRFPISFQFPDAATHQQPTLYQLRHSKTLDGWVFQRDVYYLISNWDSYGNPWVFHIYVYGSLSQGTCCISFAHLSNPHVGWLNNNDLWVLTCTSYPLVNYHSYGRWSTYG